MWGWKGGRWLSKNRPPAPLPSPTPTPAPASSAQFPRPSSHLEADGNWFLAACRDPHVLRRDDFGVRQRWSAATAYKVPKQSFSFLWLHDDADMWGVGEGRVWRIKILKILNVIWNSPCVFPAVISLQCISPDMRKVHPCLHFLSGRCDVTKGTDTDLKLDMLAAGCKQRAM